MLAQSGNIINKYKHLIAPAAVAVLSFSFFIFYFTQGIALSKVTGYDTDQNIFFGADHLEPVWGWVCCHKGVHPLLLLFVVPITNFVSIFIPTKLSSVLVVNSLFGSLGTLLAYFFFRKLTQQFVESILVSILFGLSASHLIFSSIPESYSLSACSIIITYIVFLFCLQQKKMHLMLWVLAGILTLGVVVTNFIQTLICFTITLFVVEMETKKIRVFVQYVLTVFLSVLCLNIFQYFFWGGEVMIDPQAYIYETTYLKPLLFSQPLLAVKEIMKNFFLINIVASFPSVALTAANIPVLSFYNAPLNFTIYGLLGIMIWTILIIRRLFEKKHMQLEKYFIMGASLSVFGNILIHMFFNPDEMFLYTPNFTFAVFLLIMPFRSKNGIISKLLLTLLIFLVGINNLIIMNYISAL